jgi:hypothetical protein
MTFFILKMAKPPSSGHDRAYSSNGWYRFPFGDQVRVLGRLVSCVVFKNHSTRCIPVDPVAGAKFTRQ